MSYQVEQDAGHLQSDLESPGVSFGPKIFRSVEWSLINSSLCMSNARQAHLFCNCSTRLFHGTKGDIRRVDLWLNGQPQGLPLRG